MKRSMFARLKKYYFVIIFALTFIIFSGYLAVNAMCKIKQEKHFDISITNPTSENESAEDTTKQQTSAREEEKSTLAVEDVTQTNESKPDEVAENCPPEQDINEQNRPFITADISYLDGALFIGDSRTMTLSEYASWDSTHFFVETGLTIWTVMDAKIAKVNGHPMTVRRALQSKSYNKIYIMLGINELGRGTPASFCEQYQSVIDEIRQIQPNSTIYIQSIMHVTQSKDDQGNYINNNEVNIRNDKIKNIADNVNVFWIDQNEVLDKPGTNKLNPEYTSDGIHLKPMYISVWRDFILSHVAK